MVSYSLAWQEEVQEKEELRQLKEAKFGKAIQGERIDIELRSSSERGSIRAISKETEQNIGKLSQDLQLAKALKEYPQIGKVKTKTGALIEL